MASRVRKSQAAKPVAFEGRFAAVVNAGLIIAALANFLALGWGVWKSEPRVERYDHSVVSNHFFVVTQVVERVSSRVSPPGGGVGSASAVVEIDHPYSHMVIDGVPMIRYCGRYYSAGDTISYGRIVAVFPDRLQLEDGVWIRNTFDPDAQIYARSIIKEENGQLRTTAFAD